MTNLEEKIYNLLVEKVEELELNLFDVEYVKEGKEYRLKIYIDKVEESVSIEDCEKVTNLINDMLDEADYIKDQYYLEVSSAGIEKTLKYDRHYEQYIGKTIEVNLFSKFENKKQYVGQLEKYNEHEVVILTDDEEISFERKNISNIKTVYDWNKM